MGEATKEGQIFIDSTHTSITQNGANFLRLLTELNIMSAVCNNKRYTNLPIKVHMNAWVNVQHYTVMSGLHVLSTMPRWNWF